MTPKSSKLIKYDLRKQNQNYFVRVTLCVGPYSTWILIISSGTKINKIQQNVENQQKVILGPTWRGFREALGGFWVISIYFQMM